MIRSSFGAALSLTLAFLPGISFGNPGAARVRRQYPIPNAIEETIVTNLGITANGPYSEAALGEGDVISVSGSRSGSHETAIHLSDDRETLIIHPIQPFVYNETVRVLVRAELADGSPLTDSFQFRTMVLLLPVEAMARRMDRFVVPEPEDTTDLADTLPPMVVTTDNDPTPGTIFITNFTTTNPAPNNTYLFNLDEHGNILKKQNIGHTAGLDFKVQPSGMLTYFNSSSWRFYGLDSAWNLIDSFTSANGYPVDEHELRVFPDGGYALLAVSGTSLDSSQWVPGMRLGVTIGGDVIQIFDAHHNEVFEWRGIDHYRVADAIHVNLADTGGIDFEHANSLDFDSSGHVLISNRHLCELTQIDTQTGAMVWRFGGAHNQFQLLGDSIWFSYQHAARWLPNGHMVLFDNSNFDSVYAKPLAVAGVYINQSRALEYVLDTNAMTATLVWQFHHNPETFTIAMGNVDRLPNGNTFIGWGFNKLTMTEVRPDNSTVFEMHMDSGNVSYRAFKYPSAPSSVAPTPVPASLGLSVSAAGTNMLANFTMPQGEDATIQVCDVLGREVEPVVATFETTGTHTFQLPTLRLHSGTYYCELRLADGQTAVAPFAITN